MNEEREIVITEHPRVLSLGALPTTGPVALIQQASAIATELANIIKARGLSSRIQGREFVHVEGWSTMGAMLGVLPRECTEATRRLEDGSYEATVELIRVSDGAVIGRAAAICGMDEKDRHGKPTWANRPEYARRSMAVTRATGKAYRLGFSWIMALAGYEPTPAEEMVDGVFEEVKTAKSNTGRKQAAKPATKPSASVVEPLPPDKWDTIIPPADFNDLWQRQMWALIGFKARQHAVNTIKGETFESVEGMWQFLVNHQRSKIEDEELMAEIRT